MNENKSNKVLVISTVPVPPVTAGNSKCIFEYTKMLSSIGYEVDFLFVEDFKHHSSELRNELQKYWGDRLHVFRWKPIVHMPLFALKYFRSKIVGFNKCDDRYTIGLSSYLKKLCKGNKYDAVITNYIITTGAFSKDLQAKKILYTHDVFSFKKRRYKEKSFWFDMTPNEEAKGLKRADVILSIQDNESAYFKYLYPEGDVYSVYSYFTTHEQPLTYNKNILFLSGKNTLNYNGIKWFIDKVFPIVIAEHPDSCLCIGGSICDMLKEYQNPNIKLIGRVENESDLYALGDIAINPIYQGTGLKIKTFEALSYGKVTIVHPHSTEGIYRQETAPVLVSENPSEMASMINKVISNQSLRVDFSRKSIEYINTLNKYVQDTFKNAIDK